MLGLNFPHTPKEHSQKKITNHRRDVNRTQILRVCLFVVLARKTFDLQFVPERRTIRIDSPSPVDLCGAFCNFKLQWHGRPCLCYRIGTVFLHHRRRKIRRATKWQIQTTMTGGNNVSTCCCHPKAGDMRSKSPSVP